MTLLGAALAPVTGGASLAIGMGWDSMRKANREGRDFENQTREEMIKANRPKFIDPRQGRQSALSQFSVNPRQGRQGQASMLSAASGMFPSLLR